MSDLSESLEALARSRTQLPVRSYFDVELFRREQELIFQSGPRYIGHELAVTEVGRHYALPQEGDGRALVRTPDGIELISNVCRHRQGVILRGRGQIQGNHIVCPLHRWTYDLHGRLVGAPHFDRDPCLNLRNYPLQRWNGLLFEANGFDVAAEMAATAPHDALDFSGYVLDKVHLHECDYNWKTFIEVYLEDYHVVPFHPGLGNFVTCDDLKWEIADAYSAQTVGVKDGFAKPGTPAYAKWHEALTRYLDGKPAKQGAIWFLYYPNVMIEWYPHVLVVSTLFPRSPTHTTNVVEFYYPEEIVLFERDFIAAEQAAYMETADEDDIIAKRMDRGRRLLHERGENEVGPYQSPMEDGMMHFHEYLKRGLAGHV